MAKFEPSLQVVLSHEGSFVDNPADPGGATQNGISLRFFKKKVKSDATADDLKKLTINDIAAIYREFFWDRQQFLNIFSQKICDRVFDLHINTGQGIAILQRALNNHYATHLVVDNILGHATLDVLNAKSENEVYNAIVQEATDYYNNVVKHNPSQSIFLKGWLHRLAN